MTPADTAEQATLGEFASDGVPPDSERCEAISTSTGERCKRRALPGVPYCPDPSHMQLLASEETDG
jgi:hypothetical protein